MSALVNTKSNEKKFSIKLLLTNALTGSLIGSGGKAIKELMAESGSRVSVSGNNELFPGTSDRIVQIIGDFESISMTLTLIWEMLGLIAGVDNAKDVEWSPTAIKSLLGQNDNMNVTLKLLIPAAAGGLILGQGGANIRSIAEESGATLTMSSKEEALFTQERVLSISGDTGRCIKCSHLVLAKLSEQDEIIPYASRGFSYTGVAIMSSGAPSNPRQVGNNRRAAKNAPPAISGETPEVLEPETTITLSVPDELVGNILGNKGTTMREIIAISGAKVTISPRDEFVENTRNRLVTIVGTSVCAQRAHLLINQRLQTPARKSGNRT